MAGRFLLDTNIIIALFAGEAPVREHLATAAEVFLSSIAVGELCFGARKSERVAENLQRIEELATSSVVLPCDIETARRYGEIKSALRAKGLPLPENDIWIAAIAAQYGLTVVTRDGHYSRIDGIAVTAW